MDAVVNMNHEVSIVGYWIFDSNNKKELIFTNESLNQITKRKILPIFPLDQLPTTYIADLIL